VRWLLVPLLTGDVPNVDLDAPVVDDEGAGLELNTDGGLGAETELIAGEAGKDEIEAAHRRRERPARRGRLAVGGSSGLCGAAAAHSGFGWRQRNHRARDQTPSTLHVPNPMITNSIAEIAINNRFEDSNFVNKKTLCISSTSTSHLYLV
jgi:hypothetical protein